MSDFGDRIRTAYATSGPAVDLGRGVLGGTTDPAAVVQLSAAMCNRHGLIAGATAPTPTPARKAKAPAPKPAARKTTTESDGVVVGSLKSREGRSMVKRVARGVFDMLKK